MGPIDAFWHFCNFLAPACVVAALTTAACRLLWRRELAGRRWRELLQPTLLAAVLAQLAGLGVWGRDGRIATYALLVLAVALVLWWRAFGPARREG